MQIANVKHSHCEAKFAACGKPNLGEYTAKPRQRGRARNCYLLKCQHIFGFYYTIKIQIVNLRLNSFLPACNVRRIKSECFPIHLTSSVLDSVNCKPS